MVNAKVASKRKGYVPERGDIVWLQFTPQSGHEQAGHRPALVISPHKYNEIVGLALFCPVTNKVKGYPFEVGLPAKGKVAGVVLSDQIKSLDWRARNATLICKTPHSVVDEVIAKIQALLQ